MLYQYPTYDKQTHGPSTQGSRYVNLRRKVRGQTTFSPRETKNDGAGIGRQNRDSVSNASQMGICGSLPDQRATSHSCRSTRNQAWNSYSKPLENIFKKIRHLYNSLLDNYTNGGYNSYSAAESNTFRIFASPFHWLLAAPQAGGRGVFLTTQD